ncbi:MAG: HAMP domain-containing histidine kinase [Flavobacteriales bacterium]|jgi:signal transduction histidine kinase|nr:HAMP domain-containing histidine kinase [Flavobacteriales bacterium]
MPDQDEHFDPNKPHQREERLHRFSHALKNRLGSIWQAASMLHDLPEGPERAMLVAMAEKNYFAGARELEQLMEDFAVPRGITQLQRAPVELAPLLERCIASIGFRTEKKAQKVRFANPEAITVEGDAHVLEQLFEALLSNASKFSPKGSVIELDLRTDAGFALIEVRDHGCGLTETDLHDLFTRYAMLSTRSTDGESQARGTLARAKQWATAHGGSLSATSAGPGHGSQFSVRLPLS